MEWCPNADAVSFLVQLLDAANDPRSDHAGKNMYKEWFEDYKKRERDVLFWY